MAMTVGVGTHVGDVLADCINWACERIPWKELALRRCIRKINFSWKPNFRHQRERLFWRQFANIHWKHPGTNVCVLRIKSTAVKMPGFTKISKLLGHRPSNLPPSTSTTKRGLHPSRCCHSSRLRSFGARMAEQGQHQGNGFPHVNVDNIPWEPLKYSRVAGGPLGGAEGQPWRVSQSQWNVGYFTDSDFMGTFRNSGS